MLHDSYYRVFKTLYITHYMLYIIPEFTYILYYIYLKLVKECLGNCFTHGKLFSLVMHESKQIF